MKPRPLWRLYRGRFRKSERGGALLYHDYAHHPTEVAATLAAAR